ncbi:nucleotide pyrophosphohydrolase [Candidatus Neptunochlamydia vexilliferae]|uniref:dCTP pyrophosphatase 1 n=1 Tax=Candidatus Neptunichlamydia vexilliferae TaxID=1651774 RepID=A0ABS0B1L3_9BACT|nr:nucleotide pyrophosphohydrolase [Candidatus Neptunochlamydia vexilliferae]MBF5060069.1 dCTP pyrophosphatase 1 [Candidatus Neptunochlamydia vexilliferae]
MENFEKSSDPSPLNIKEMQEYSRRFIEDRDWTEFHTPKNIAMGISVEAAELLEIFQWLTPEQSFQIKSNSGELQRVSDEVGDILHLLIRLSSLLNIDLKQAFWEKIKKTEKKYPISLSKGKTAKYSRLSHD